MGGELHPCLLRGGVVRVRDHTVLWVEGQLPGHGAAPRPGDHLVQGVQGNLVSYRTIIQVRLLSNTYIRWLYKIVMLEKSKK